MFASRTITIHPIDPNAFNTAPETVTLTATDDGGLKDTATFTVRITPVNDPPSFTAGAPVTVDEATGAYNTSWATAVSTGPANEKQNPVFTCSIPAADAALFTATGKPVISANGKLSFTPAPNAFGSTTITVSLSDGEATYPASGDQPITCVLTITSVNDPPSFTAGGAVTVEEDSGTSSKAWATSINTGPANENQVPVFTCSGYDASLFTTTGQPTINASGTLTFTPADHAFGTTTVTVSLSDGVASYPASGTQPIRFILNITGINDPPSFTAGAAVTVDEDSGAYNTTWATAVSTGPANENQSASFTCSIPPTDAALFTANGKPAISANGTLSFNPAPNAFGSTTVTVTVSDGLATYPATGQTPVTFTLTIASINDPPAFTAGGAMTVGEDSGAYSKTWATAISTGPANENQTPIFICSIPATDEKLFAGRPAISATGTLTFTPAKDASGSTTVTVSLSDGLATYPGAGQSAATCTLVITAIDDAPSFSLVDGTVNHGLGKEPTPLLAPGNTLSDVDGGTSYAGMTLRVTLQSVPPVDPAPNEDTLLVMPVAGLTMSSTGATRTIAATGTPSRPVATWTGPVTGGTPLELTLLPTATQADLPLLAASVCYRNDFGVAASNPTVARQAHLQFQNSANGGNHGISTTSTIRLFVNNTAPEVKNNTVCYAAPLARATLTNDILLVTDNTATADQMRFTVDAAPLYGRMERDRTVLGVGGTFTQADITAGLISYVNTNANASSDQVVLTVSDSADPPLTTFLVLGFRISPELRNYLILSDPPMFAEAGVKLTHTVLVRPPNGVPDATKREIFVVETAAHPADTAGLGGLTIQAGVEDDTQLLKSRTFHLTATTPGRYVFDIIYAESATDPNLVARQPVLLVVVPTSTPQFPWLTGGEG